MTFVDHGAALGCAVAIQEALQEHRRRNGFAPSVRIGLHMAEATREGADWSGVGVHAAARVGALAEAEEILLSRETAEVAGLRIASRSRAASRSRGYPSRSPGSPSSGADARSRVPQGGTGYHSCPGSISGGSFSSSCAAFIAFWTSS